jgi:hypothetical protein
MNRRTLIGFGAALATASGVASFSSAAMAQAPEVAKVPDDMVSIHYHRPAGDYDGWGVHLWESFEKVENNKTVSGKQRSDTPLQGISWMAPMKPTGKDGFGVFWQVKANEFRNTKVNYIIHRGDTKDQCGKDMFWFVPQGRQIFVNQGDCNIYFSADEAIKARK